MASIGLAIAGCSSPFGLSSTSGAASSLSAADRNFVAQAAYGGLAEVAVGKVAQQQAATPAVRQFGEMMVSAHTPVNQELVQIAAAKGVTPPTAPDPGRQAVAAELQRLSGSEFDRQYLALQMADHQLQATLFQSEAQGGQDPDLRAFAQRTLPKVQSHLQELRQIAPNTLAAQ